jgi:hypothetical protein
MDTKLQEMLIKAVEHEEVLTYGYIGEQLGIHPRIVEKLFSEVDETFKENGLPPISTIVVNGTDLICGEGYFKEHYPKIKDRLKIWVDNLNTIFSNKSKVIDLIATK